MRVPNTQNIMCDNLTLFIHSSRKIKKANLHLFRIKYKQTVLHVDYIIVIEKQTLFFCSIGKKQTYLFILTKSYFNV